ncbi:MAG: M1 family aminopeptidase, partial [Myxococcota bacterium]
MTRLDPHSYADDAQPNTTRMTLCWWVDILRSEIRGTATLQLDRPASGTLDLDTRDLTIEAVTDGSGQSIRFELADPDPVLGQRLRLAVVSDIVHIQYRTSPNASALQWLTPAQTTGGRHPFVFTQCQAIHARSIVPCQDTPRVRVRFSATVDVPKPLHAVMAAAATGQSDGEDGRSVFTFDMPQPIPPYLLAFAAGDLASADVGPRSRVYAEPDVIDAAAWEFADIDAHLERAEALFGPYEWDRFDMLVMPASFPYGGMENPRLTFLTPTLLAGDRSLVSVVAHELAHSWTGNLVTNANANHFWLNEGFTVYAERRIVEALYGRPTRLLHDAVERKHLEDDIARLSATDPALTQLRVDLEGHDPDEVYSSVPYEKGYLFLARLEQAAGRDRFDVFLKRYIERFRFTSIVTDDLLELLRAEFSDLIADINLDVWIDGPGLPNDAPQTPAPRLDEVTALANDWRLGQRPSTEALDALTADEWRAFLASLPDVLPLEEIAWCEQTRSLSTSKNAEIRVGWLAIAARSGAQSLFDAIEAT